MNDTTVIKVDSQHSPHGAMGQQYLATGKSMEMRLWQDEVPGEPKPSRSRPYETIGYVLKGRAELILEGQTVNLQVGDSYVVPQGAKHTYRILERFSAVEVTSPPASIHGRDQ